MRCVARHNGQLTSHHDMKAESRDDRYASWHRLLRASGELWRHRTSHNRCGCRRRGIAASSSNRADARPCGLRHGSGFIERCRRAGYSPGDAGWGSARGVAIPVPRSAKWIKMPFSRSIVSDVRHGELRRHERADVTFQENGKVCIAVRRIVITRTAAEQHRTADRKRPASACLIWTTAMVNVCCQCELTRFCPSILLRLML